MAIESTSISGDAISSPETATNKLTLNSLNVPTTPSSEGTKGQLEWEAEYLYICIATNTWARTKISKDWGTL